MRKIKRLYAFLLAGLLSVAMCVSLAGCRASWYSEEQHIARVRERAEERFLGEGSEYTGLEVYPIYNEYDELKYMLIEFAPQGFLYVAIDDIAYPWKGMYTLSDTEPVGWWPYRVKEGERGEVVDEEGNLIQYYDREYFLNEEGKAIVYHQSHFKVAGIENERRYILLINDGGNYSAKIPAVKRGEQYLDLVDGALIDYTPGMESEAYATGDITFIGKSNFDL